MREFTLAAAAAHTAAWARVPRAGNDGQHLLHLQRVQHHVNGHVGMHEQHNGSARADHKLRSVARVSSGRAVLQLVAAPHLLDLPGQARQLVHSRPSRQVLRPHERVHAHAAPRGAKCKHGSRAATGRERTRSARERAGASARAHRGVAPSPTTTIASKSPSSPGTAASALRSTSPKCACAMRYSPIDSVISFALGYSPSSSSVGAHCRLLTNSSK